MKKSLSLSILAAAVLISTSNVSAAERPSFGILGGLHFTNLAINPDPTDASLASLRRANIGGLVDFDLGPNVSLQARCMYVQKGAALEDVAEEIDLNARTIINYVTVPVLLKIQADTATIRPYAVIGPELGFKVSARASFTTTSSLAREILNMLEDELQDELDNNLKSTDVALDFGGGIEVPYGRMSFLIEGIYSLGVRNIAVVPEGEEDSAKTRTFLFNVGISF